MPTLRVRSVLVLTRPRLFFSLKTSIPRLPLYNTPKNRPLGLTNHYFTKQQTHPQSLRALNPIAQEVTKTNPHVTTTTTHHLTRSLTRTQPETNRRPAPATKARTYSQLITYEDSNTYVPSTYARGPISCARAEKASASEIGPQKGNFMLNCSLFLLGHGC